MSRQRGWLRALTFLLLLGAAGWPWQTVEVGFSRVVSALANVCLAARSGSVAQLELLPLGPGNEQSSGDNVHADTQMILRLSRPLREARLGLSLRRDAYLPLVVFVAAMLVLPLPPRSRLYCLALGIPLVFAAAIVSVAVLGLSLLGDVPGAGIADWLARLCRFLFEVWLTPPGNRVIAPLLLAAGLGFSAEALAEAQRRRRVATTD